MLEIPESKTISTQASTVLVGKKIVEIVDATSSHKFTWYCGDPKNYSQLLMGRTIESIEGHGAFIDIHCDSNVSITLSDGTHMKYYFPLDKYPDKHQLLLVFDDGTFLAFTVSMYGSIYAYKETLENSYYQGSLNSISPLSEAFDETYFEAAIWNGVSKDISIKALLATEQRILGLGNGMLQDILFNAAIHPKRKKSTLSDFEKGELFESLKTTLQSCTDRGGRDTEKDFYGNFGGYKTILSKKTYKEPCPNCGGIIKKEAYLGGTIYYCPICQIL